MELLWFFSTSFGIAVDASCSFLFTLMYGEELNTSAFLFAGQKLNALIAC